MRFWSRRKEAMSEMVMRPRLRMRSANRNNSSGQATKKLIEYSTPSKPLKKIMLVTPSSAAADM
ncbi:hypothetical protein D9M70_609490 [compost metagenome]